MGKLKGVLLIALIMLCHVMQVVVSQEERETRRKEERGMSPEEEEWRAKEEWHRGEKTAEEERDGGTRRREERGMPPEEEEWRAKEEEWRRREKTAEEERGGRTRRREERGMPPEEEEWRAKEEEWRRREKTAEEERGGRTRRREERGMSPEEEERKAKEEEWRRREKTAEEEHRHQRRERWEEEEEGRERPVTPRRREEEEERERPVPPRRREEEEEEEEERERPVYPVGPGGRGKEMFLLKKSKQVVRTAAGEMRVVRGFGGRIVDKPLHIGFITMEPHSMFVPQYLDSSLIIFIRRGEAKIGLIYEDELGERQLRMGDVYRIPAGSTFYIVNTGETQSLSIICSIDASEGIGYGTFQSFFIGGGIKPVSVLAGFDPQTLSTAFNVSIGELQVLMTMQEGGPIVYADTRAPNGTDTPILWANFLKLKEEERLKRLKMVATNGDREEKENEKEETTWTWRNILDPLLGKQDKREGKGDTRRTGSAPDSYNLYDRDPSFRNGYGWSIAVDKHDYQPLKKSGVGVYLVNLTAGSMMAPHLNPMATEYGVVLRGGGTIQVVYPNGTSAMNARVNEGDVFWIPRYFPFCQIASRTGPFEFFGFTTSAHRNRPQFLVGASSILRTMRGPELAAAFGLTEDRLLELIDAQREAVILPSPAAAPPNVTADEPKTETAEEKKAVKKMSKFIRGLGTKMIMGFE